MRNERLAQAFFKTFEDDWGFYKDFNSYLNFYEIIFKTLKP